MGLGGGFLDWVGVEFPVESEFRVFAFEMLFQCLLTGDDSHACEASVGCLNGVTVGNAGCASSSVLLGVQFHL